jgi:hypothetical protein
LYEQVVQGFPLYIEPGGEPAATGRGFDDPSRRTAIAQDAEGNILIFSTRDGLITLREMQRWLLESGLNLDAAFNLDGGKSVGIYLELEEEPLLYSSVEPVPVVIAAYPR